MNKMDAEEIMQDKTQVNMLKIENVSKEYKLGQIGGTTLQEELQRWGARIRHKEDPTKIIGAADYNIGESFLALDRVSFSVKKGERVGIIGHNGAGKSTLLKLISRITAPTSGDIWLNGRVASMLEVGTGFHGELTGRENIYMNGAILGMKKKEIDAKIEDIIDFSECRQFIDTPVKRYSSGMYVKLAFSVAAHLDAEIMIMDEVLAVGVMAFQKKCLDKMNEVSKEECRTILYVSHNMNTIRQLCNRCIVLKDGSIVYEGDVEKAIEFYTESRTSDAVFIDYSDQAAPKWLDVQRIKLMSASYIDKHDCIFNSGEKIKVQLKWLNLIDIDSISLRVEIRSISEVRFASYVLYDFCSGKKNEMTILEIELDPLMIVEGKYYMAYTFFNHDRVGNQIDLEGRIGLRFEIASAKHTGKLIWHPNLWGFMELDNIEILSISN